MGRILLVLFLIVFTAGAKTVDQLVLEVESAKARDLWQPAGTLFAVYDPYGKTFKMIHYWIGFGSPMVRRADNTDCSKPIWAWARVKHPVWRFDPETNSTHARMVCSQDSRFTDVMRCRYPEDPENMVRLYYDRDDGRILKISGMGGAFCRRIVTPSYLKARLNLNLSGGSAGAVSTSIAGKTIDNAYFTGISYETAVDLMTRYMYSHRIQSGILVIQTFDVYTTKSGGLFRKKITYHYIEKPIYQILMTGVNAGIDVGRGYRLLDGQAVGNNLIRKNIEVFSKSKSGWTGLAVVIFQSALIAAAWYTGGALYAALNPAMTGAAMGATGAIGTGGTILGGANIGALLAGGGAAISSIAQDLKSGVFTSLVGDKVYSLSDVADSAITGAVTAGASGVLGNDVMRKDLNVYSGDGARHITQRVKTGHDGSASLSGFYEMKKQVDAFKNWNKPVGSFVDLPEHLYK